MIRIVEAGLLLGFNLVFLKLVIVIPWPNPEQAKKRTAELITKAHRHTYTLISDPSSGFIEVSRFLVHTPDQVSAIIGLVCDPDSSKF